MEDKKILSVENKEEKVVNMKENIFNDTDFSRFTSQALVWSFHSCRSLGNSR